MNFLANLRMLDWSRYLRAEPARCPVCRCASRPAGAPLPVASRQPRRELRGLCPDCLSRIPWILSPQCRVCGRPERCEDCRRRRVTHFVISRSAVRYDGTMREWLALYKYRGAERLEPVLAAMLAHALERMAAELGHAEPRKVFDVITAVPLSESRLSERSFNQAERLARRLAEWYGIPFAVLLRRIRHTEKMSFKSRSERLADVRGIFAPVPRLPALLPGQRPPVAASGFLSAHAGYGSRSHRRILVVDDVYTTGGTMNEAARALKGALGDGFELFGLTWARS